MNTYLLLCLVFPIALFSDQIYLKDKLANSNKGDFVVTSQAKQISIWHIQDKKDGAVLIEEVTVPQNRLRLPNGSWKEWIKLKGPLHSMWVKYAVDLKTGALISYYSVDQQSFCKVNEANNFLTTLLNLPFYSVPVTERKRVGGTSEYWQPPMIVEGKKVDGVHFDHWRTRWPYDRSELSGKTVDLFLPEATSPYPNYFPYWLQISGGMGKARLRIIDTGSNMISPYPPMWQN